jgi:hypothetical protein
MLMHRDLGAKKFDANFFRLAVIDHPTTFGLERLIQPHPNKYFSR